MKLESVKLKASNTCKKKYSVPYACMTNQCRNASNSIISRLNKRFKECLDKLGIDSEFEFSIDSKSYDIHILNSNILIEINPTYTHNSTTGPWFRKDYIMNEDYHYNKSRLAEENGYHCIHVFDWDNWEKVISLIDSENKEIIYARKCEIREVNKRECNEFLNNYHIQNSCKNQDIRLGLYYNDELVQIMTFGKPRYNKNYQWELLRLCSKSNYIVIGGSEKLFKYFTDNYNPESIISYCDNAKFNGDVYKRLEFELITYGKPSCHWSKKNKQITQNLLNQRGYDQLFNANYGKGTSNRELMINHGWKEVYDCGQSTYIWQKN